MDISSRDKLFEEKQKLNKSLKEAMSRMLGISSASNAAVANRNTLATKQGVKKFPATAFKEEEKADPEVVPAPEEDIVPAPEGEVPPVEGGEIAPETDLEVPVDDNADGIDDAAQGEEGASEKKMSADAVAQQYLGSLPSDVALDADDNGIVFAEFQDDHHGAFKVLLFPADMQISAVAEIKEPTDVSPLDAEEPVEGGEEISPEGEVPPVEGGELAPVEPEIPAEGGEVSPEEEIAPEEEEETPVLTESVRDRRLRKKGLIGNDRDPEVEEAEKEAERDPMRAGRKSWQAMRESRFKK